MPYRLAVKDIAFFERPVTFARPFRFGAVVINATPQAFVRVEIEVEGEGRAVGASAEFLVPKWFDKRPHLSPEQTVTELRRSLLIAREIYLAHSAFETAFGLHAACIGAQIEACAREDIPPLAAAYGPAEIDKAILDALLRCADVDFFDGMAGNIAGVNARLSRDLDDAEVSQAASGWNAWQSGTRSAWMTWSKARAGLPTDKKTPVRAISSSSSTAIPRTMRIA
jgi:hypothetical protein